MEVPMQLPAAASHQHSQGAIAEVGRPKTTQMKV